MESEYPHFEIKSPGGPSLTHHVGGVVKEGMLVHGGINKVECKKPLNNLYFFSFESEIWSDITTEKSPLLSHHACVVLDNRWLVLVGGWDGRRRRSDINVYDSVKREWVSCKTNGFPDGSGLSSHSATLLENGKILVIGREGFLKTQRRFSSMFLITASIQSKVFTYERLETIVESRSGHSCCILDNWLMVMGGRSKQFLEFHPFKTKASLTQSSSVLFNESQNMKNGNEKIIQKKFSERITGNDRSTPSARNYHASISIENNKSVLLHGGWTFDGRNRSPSSEWFILKMISCKDFKWICLEDSKVELAGHVICTDGQKIFVHGGKGKNGTVKSTLYEINFV